MTNPKGKKANHYIHGMRYHRAYNIWNHMMFRCYSEKDSHYKYYGARGIKVIKKWHNFIGFWEDMAHGYRSNLTLDRIDNDLGYNPNNCHWVTKITQLRNKRRSYVEYKGRKILLKLLCKNKKLSYHMIWQRLNKYGYSIEKALSIEPHQLKNLIIKQQYGDNN